MAIDRDKILEEAQNLVEKKRYDKAIAEYQKLLAADPKDARVLLKLGEAYLRAERYETAVSAFEQVAQVHAAAGFALKAVAVYQQAREIVQRHVPHLTDRFGHLVPRMAELYVQLKRPNDAIAVYEEAAARMESAGRQRDAIDLFKKIVELDPQTPERALRLADALMRLGDADAAAGHLGAAAQSLAARGRLDEAIDVVERALAIRADAPLARLAAQLYLDRGGPQGAPAAFMKIQIAHKLAPKELETLGLLARTLDVLRKPDKALEVHKEAARVAREIGNVGLFDHIMGLLIARAPNDPGVRKLAAQWSNAPPEFLEPPAPPPPPPQAAPRRHTPPPMPAPRMTPPTPPGRDAPLPPQPRMTPPPPRETPLPPQPRAAPPPLPPRAAPTPPTPVPRDNTPSTTGPTPVPQRSSAMPPLPARLIPTPQRPRFPAPAAAPPAPPAPPPPPIEDAPMSARAGRFDEEAIEEVEFFVSQGMFEDAISILDQQLERLPNHPLLLDRRREVEAMAAEAADQPQ